MIMGILFVLVIVPFALYESIEENRAGSEKE